MPTMIRNDQKMIGTGGQFSRGTVSSPFKRRVERMFQNQRTTPSEFRSEYLILPAAWSGHPNRISGAPFGWL